MKTKLILIGVFYYIIFALTYGYAYNDSLRFQNNHFPRWRASNAADAELDGIFGTVAWPIYWPCHLTKHLFETP